MKEIERLIQFARSNNYKFHDSILDEYYWNEYEFYIDENEIIITYWWECYNWINVIEIITSKPFIEAVARWLLKTKKWNYIYFKDWFEILIERYKDKWLEKLSTRIARDLWEALLNEKLEEFINNLLWE